MRVIHVWATVEPTGVNEVAQGGREDVELGAQMSTRNPIVEGKAEDSEKEQQEDLSAVLTGVVGKAKQCHHVKRPRDHRSHGLELKLAN